MIGRQVRSDDVWFAVAEIALRTKENIVQSGFALGVILAAAAATACANTPPAQARQSRSAPTAAAAPAAPAASGAPSRATFQLGDTTWSAALPSNAKHESKGASLVVLSGDDRYWISRYEEGAGPINLTNARSLIVDDPDPTVLYEVGSSGSVSYELVVEGPRGPRGERTIDAPDDSGATITCAFHLGAGADEGAWRAALELCRSLRPEATP